MYEVQIGLPNQPTCTESYRLTFLRLNSLYKHYRKMAALMLLLLTEATTEEKTYIVPCTTADHKLGQKIWIHTSRHRKGARKILDRKGLLASATIPANFESETNMAVDIGCPISFKFSTSCTLQGWWNKGWSKHKRKQKAVSDSTDDSCM